MRFAIIGAGAIGGLTGAYLAKDGEQVHFYDIVPEHVEAMNRDGLLVDGVVPAFRVPVQASRLTELKGPLDVVMIAVKSQHTLDALAAVEPHLGPTSTVVSLQNGLNAWRIADRIGRERVVAVFLNFGADYIGPGHIRYGGIGDYYIGRLDGPPDDLVQEIADKLARIQHTVVTDNIKGYLWAKMCWSTLLMGTALIDGPVFDAVGPTENRDVFTAAFREAVRVADAYDIQLESFKPFEPALFHGPGDPAALEAFYAGIEHMYRNRVKQHTGTWRDIAVRRRKTEIDWLAGELIRRGEQVGVSLPVVSAMVRMIHEIEDGQRPQQMENLLELGALVP